MANASKFINNAFEHLTNSFDVSSYPVGDPARLDEYVSENAADRRYKLALNAASTPIRSAIVTYRGVRYYAYQDGVTGEWFNEYAAR